MSSVDDDDAGFASAQEETQPQPQPEPEPEPQPVQTVAATPQAGPLREAVAALRAEQPTIGVKRICAELKQRPEFAGVKTMQVREIVQALNMCFAQRDHSTASPARTEGKSAGDGGDQASSQENRAQRRARLKAEASRTKKVKRHGPGHGDRGDPYAADRTAVINKAFTTDVTPPDEYEDTPLSLEMKQKVDEFMEREKRDGQVPLVEVSKLNLWFVDTSLKLQDEKEEIARQYKLESARLQNSRDPKRIATASLRCENLKQRSHAYNTNVQVYQKCTNVFNSSASRKATDDYIEENYHRGTDHSLIAKQELEEDAEWGDVSS
jgi:hypothetical protein